MRASTAVPATIAAYLLFSLSAPLTRWLMERGESTDAVSFCNLLTVGNTAAAVLAIGIYGPITTLRPLRHLTPRSGLSLFATVLLSVAAPATFFFALASTSVANVILISRAGPVFFALIGTIALRKPVTRNQWIGYGFILTAIALAVLGSSDAMICWGDALALMAALGAAMASILGRPALDHMGLGPFVFARNALAAAAFAGIAVYFFGVGHFADLLDPSIVAGVAVYGVLVVGLAQLLWFHAIVHAPPATVGGWSFLSPLSAITLSIVLLGQRPHPAQWASLGLVMIGMFIASRRRHDAAPNPPPLTTLAAAR